MPEACWGSRNDVITNTCWCQGGRSWHWSSTSLQADCNVLGGAIWWRLGFATSWPPLGEGTEREKVEVPRDPRDPLPSGPRLWGLLQENRQGLGYMSVTWGGVPALVFSSHPLARLEIPPSPQIQQVRKGAHGLGLALGLHWASSSTTC